MFELLFKYPLAVFEKGKFVLLGSWPVWCLLLGIAVAMGVTALPFWRRRRAARTSVRAMRSVALWTLQAATLAILLLLLWEPAISITALRPQENILAVVVDNSRSMGVADAGSEREQQAVDLLRSKLLPRLSRRFQVRLYSLNANLSRVSDVTKLRPTGAATQIGAGLKQLADEAATLPIGAVVLLSDGSDNSGGIDQQTIDALRRRRLPVNTIGFGREELKDDIEMDGLSVPSTVLVDSRVEARVTLRQNGFTGRRAVITITADDRPVASREVVLTNSRAQAETLEFNAGKSGVRRIVASIAPLRTETNVENNRRTMVLSVNGTKHRILYVEGEPRWEYKFLRRAAEDDPALEIVSMLRTTQNKIYRQGISNPNELIDGFPSKPEELFRYDGIILGSVEAGFFTPEQQQEMKDFVDRRGGGLLFLGGRASLADGDYDAPPFRELLPVKLPHRKNTFQRTLVAAELTEQGKRSLICKIETDTEDSVNHWNVLPYMADYQDPGTPKPGAVVLARTDLGRGNKIPLLVTQNYGRGRTAVFATGGSWRWRMQQPVADTSHRTFWRQLLRWTAGTSPSPVVASTSVAELEDNADVDLQAEVRNKGYQLVSDADVEADVIEPDGSAQRIRLQPDASAAGVYRAHWTAAQAGSYVAEISAKRNGTELGSDVVTFGRENGLAENFHREQNRELLTELARQTGGQYYTPAMASRLPEEVSFSEAGITARETKDLWNMPIVFLALLTLRSCEWLLRRRWGLV